MHNECILSWVFNMYTLFQQIRSKQNYQTLYFQLAHNKFSFVFYFKLNHHALLFCILCLKINTITIINQTWYWSPSSLITYCFKQKHFSLFIDPKKEGKAGTCATDFWDGWVGLVKTRSRIKGNHRIAQVIYWLECAWRMPEAKPNSASRKFWLTLPNIQINI